MRCAETLSVSVRSSMRRLDPSEKHAVAACSDIPHDARLRHGEQGSIMARAAAEKEHVQFLPTLSLASAPYTCNDIV